MRLGRSRPRWTASRLGIALAGTWALIAAAGAPAAHAIEPFGVQRFEVKTCAEKACAQPDDQADGHPNSVELAIAFTPHGGEFRNLRVDLPPGFSIDPQATPECEVEPIEAHLETECTASKVGRAEFDSGSFGFQRPGLYSIKPAPGSNIPFEVAIATKGFLGGEGGLAQNVVVKGGVSWHRESGVNVPTGNYHEYFYARAPVNVHVLSIQARLTGDATPGTSLVQLPGECSGGRPWHLQAESSSHAENSELPSGTVSEVSEMSSDAPTEIQGCQSVPFESALDVAPSAVAAGGNTASDAPDGVAVTLGLPQHTEPSELGTADAKQIVVTLPEGMTINPSAAKGLQTCGDSEFGVSDAAGSNEPPEVEEAAGEATAVACPPGSKIGAVEVQTPDLPAPLTGAVYLGTPLSDAPASGQEYRIFLTASAPQDGIEVRLVGNVAANAATGRLQATVPVPQVPFSGATLRLNGGPSAPLANPLTCGEATSQGALSPYSASALAASVATFSVTGCPAPLAFTPVETSEDHYLQAGASTPLTLDFAREGGQPYLSQLATTLPAGLLGDIASVPTLCQEPQANAGDCPPASEIGTVRATAGSGSEPLTVPAADEPPGAVYLTGPYDGSPYGLAIEVDAEHVSPYRLGEVVARATVSLDPYTARVTITAVESYVRSDGSTALSPTPLPSMVGGVPVRLRSIAITLQRPHFVVNPTNCQQLSMQATLVGVASPLGPDAATATLLTPFQVGGCGALAFSPGATATATAPSSRAGGTSLAVSVTPVAGQANLGAVTLALPPELVARLSRLQQGCTGSQFASSPGNCPAASRVASGTLKTPLLPDPLTGSGYLVSHGGAFPDLDFVLEGDDLGLIEVGTTAIRNGITTVTFTGLPDAPFEDFTATFAGGSSGLIAANASLCARIQSTRAAEVVLKHGRLATATRTIRRQVPLTLTMPTTFTAQDGATVTHSTPIAVSGCRGKTAVKAATALYPAVHVRGHSALVTVAAPGEGRVTVRGQDIKPVTHTLTSAATLTLKAALSAAGVQMLRRHHELHVALHVVFKPTGEEGQSALAASRTVLFRT